MQLAFETDEVKKMGNLPKHVAIIMDGNGRWAQSMKRPRIFGHKNGANRVREIVELAGRLGIEVLTLFAFSEENWFRPKDEVNALFRLLANYLKSEVSALHKQNVRLSAIGDRSKIPMECRNLLQAGEDLTRNNTGLKLTLALNYGGRSEIVNSCREIAQAVLDGKMTVNSIDHKILSERLSTSELPDPDLLIRTSGEQRISNFLLWQMAYTEFYFTTVNWPDFTEQEFLKAITIYQQRQRRFGKVQSQLVDEASRPGEDLRC